ncbi:MAG: hypothetical protein R3272_01345 [Candidatus Promineifilaceae bacterium]|nr:hypothetical protein [Candidatus Promineifilaceae bacterium]
MNRLPLVSTSTFRTSRRSSALGSFFHWRTFIALDTLGGAVLFSFMSGTLTPFLLLIGP